MKRKVLSLVLFLIVFVSAYLVICFAIPGMRIKLEAEPVVYFLESIRHMALIKTAVSLAAALIIGAIPLLFCKKKETER
ncbi:MAG: hypothetical protein IJF56_04955 [Clostridia bacterium]|nr:hypothetical protein [Clostridia bacterium]